MLKMASKAPIAKKVNMLQVGSKWDPNGIQMESKWDPNVPIATKRLPILGVTYL